MNKNSTIFNYIWRTSSKLALAVVLVGLFLGLQSLSTFRDKTALAAGNQVSGETVTVEPAGKASWQEIVDYEANNPIEPTLPMVIPYMPMPAPRELQGAVNNQSSGETTTVTPAGEANFQEMAAFESAHPDESEEQKVVPFMSMPEPREISPGDASALMTTDSSVIPLAAPETVHSFLGLDDNNTSIPPDTHGAAGPDHLMVMLNTQVRIQSKTGANISTVSLNTFWTGGTGLSGNPFDPKIVYDSLSDRWMATVDADSRSATSAVWFAISDTSDPTGNWTFYAFDADGTDANWADYPGFGINSTWIAITNNMFTVAANAFVDPKMWVIDKSTALAGGALTLTVFNEGFDTAGGFDGFTLKPAMTFDAAEMTLYIVDNSGLSAGGTYLLRLSQITGTGPAPIWSAVAGSTYAGTGLFFVANNFNYSQIDAEQLGTITDVETNDTRALNAVYRNGRLWTTHSAGLPASGSDRTASFWYEVNPAAMPNPIVQSGYVAGGVDTHYFFPSITVNANNDAVLGFSYSDGTQYVEAAYTGRESIDAAGTMGTVTTCKAGEDSYVKDFGSGRIRWGDYSATVIDPTDDLTFWTLQEYAETDVGGGASDDRWGTWWCRAQVGNFWQGDDATNPTLWNVPANWSLGVVPTCATDAVIPTNPSGGANFPTVNVPIANVRNLTIAAGANLNLAGATLNVCGNWDNSGNFVNGGGTVDFNGSTTQNLTANVPTTFANLTVSSGTTLVETITTDNVSVNGTLTNNGTIRKSKFNLQTASTTFGLTGASINIFTLGNLSTLLVDRVGSAQSNENSNGGGTNMLDTYYALTPDATDQSFDLELCLHYTDAELAGSPDVANELNLRLCRWTGSAWSCPARTGSSSTGNNTVCGAGVDTFSDWTMGEVGPTTIALKSVDSQTAVARYSGLLLFALFVLVGSGLTLVLRKQRLSG